LSSVTRKNAPVVPPLMGPQNVFGYGQVEMNQRLETDAPEIHRFKKGHAVSHSTSFVPPLKYVLPKKETESPSLPGIMWVKQ